MTYDLGCFRFQLPIVVASFRTLNPKPNKFDYPIFSYIK